MTANATTSAGAASLRVCPYTSDTSVACRHYQAAFAHSSAPGAEACRYAVVDEITDVTRRRLCYRGAAAPRQVLIVEDETDLRHLLRLRLRRLGAVVRSAADGAVALDTLSGWMPDAVITDWHMPNMDGVELVRQIRDNPELGGLPVLFWTSDSPGRLTDRCVGLEGVAIVPKSASAALLREQLETAVRSAEPTP